MIRLKFFASLREQLGFSSLNVDYAGQKTVAELMQELLQKGEIWCVLREKNVLVAVNQTLSGQDARVNDGDEVAFFPPVTGG
jgi:molybdopterin synthase sulfur carrier subunit